MRKTSAAALATATMLAAALWSAGPANAITCPAGYVPSVAGNGADFCSPTGTGGVGGGGSVGTAPGTVTTPGQAGPVNGGGMGPAPAPLPRYVPAPAAPYVPPIQAPAPAAPAAPITNQYVAPKDYSAPQSQVGGVALAPAAGEEPVVMLVEAVPAEALAAVDTETDASAVVPAEAVQPDAQVSQAPVEAADAPVAVDATQTSAAEGIMGAVIAGILGLLVVTAAFLYLRKQPDTEIGAR
ncbi:hypothetical protein [Arthrobacter sp. UYCo732]|uniref:hypothetical protein n=1 Tax=Arthrobacter sp. UYCo732 TaxID=3156336 RepID=UPI00339A67BB